jgi:uncharacterized protein (DUF305 family)
MSADLRGRSVVADERQQPNEALALVRRPSSIVIALLAVALLAALAALWLGRPPGEGSAEARFVRDMITHHEQAVEMALFIRDRTTDETLRAFATDIILTQQGQIGRMSGWLEVWGLPFAGVDDGMAGMREMMGMAAQGDVNALATLPLPEAEVRFLQLMTTHHEGALFMAEDVLAANPTPEVARLAEAVLRGQQGEIGLMRELLALRGAEPPAPLQRMGHGH